MTEPGENIEARLKPLFWILPGLAAAALLTMGWTGLPAFHFDSVAYSLPGIHFARTGELSNPAWHDAARYAAQGSNVYNYHGILYPILIGKVGCTSVPQLLKLLGLINACSVLLFAYLCIRLQRKPLPTPRDALLWSAMLGLSSFVVALWLRHNLGRPEPLAFAIAAIAFAALMNIRNLWCFAAMLGIGAAMTALCSPVTGIFCGLAFFSYAVARWPGTALLKLLPFALLAALGAALVLVQAFYPGSISELLSGISAHARRQGGGRSLRLIPEFWIFSRELPLAFVPFLGAAIWLCAWLRSATLSFACKLAVLASLFAFALLFYWSAVAFSYRMYNGLLPAIASLVLCVVGFNSLPGRAFPIGAILLFCVPGFTFFQHVRSCAQYAKSGVTYQQIAQVSELCESRLKEGERIGCSTWSPAAWTGVQDFRHLLTFGFSLRAADQPQYSNIKFRYLFLNVPVTTRPPLDGYRLFTVLQPKQGTNDIARSPQFWDYSIAIFELDEAHSSGRLPKGDSKQ